MKLKIEFPSDKENKNKEESLLKFLNRILSGKFIDMPKFNDSKGKK